MADREARKAAMRKASAQVRSAGSLLRPGDVEHLSEDHINEFLGAKARAKKYRKAIEEALDWLDKCPYASHERAQSWSEKAAVELRSVLEIKAEPDASGSQETGT